MELNKKIDNLEQEIFNIQKKITGLEISSIDNNTNNTNNTNFENNIEIKIDEEIYRSMPPIVRMNAFNRSMPPIVRMNDFNKRS